MDESTEGVEQVAMGASTRGPASRSEKAVITVWLKSRGGQEGKGPQTGGEADPDHKGHPVRGEEVKFLS